MVWFCRTNSEVSTGVGFSGHGNSCNKEGRKITFFVSRFGIIKIRCNIGNKLKSTQIKSFWFSVKYFLPRGRYITDSSETLYQTVSIEKKYFCRPADHPPVAGLRLPLCSDDHRGLERPDQPPESGIENHTQWRQPDRNILLF